MKVRSLITAAVLMFACLAQPAFAASVTIAWNAAEENVAGYIVKYGTRPGEYAAQVNVGRSTTFKAEDLVVGQTYYFTVQAYAADGSTGAPATELPAVVIGASRGVASRLLSPQAGAEDVTSAQVFSWEQVAKAEAYDFSIGTVPGGRDVVDSGETKRQRLRPTICVCSSISVSWCSGVRVPAGPTHSEAARRKLSSQ